MLVFNKGLDSFLHALIPAALRDSIKINTVAYLRVRALTAMLVMGTCVTAISWFIAITIHQHRPELHQQDMLNLFVLLLICLQTWLFYKFNNYWISGLAFTNFYFLVVALWVIISGGYDSPSRMILLTCPMVSFLIGGRQEGIQNTVIIIVFYQALVFLNFIDFDLPNIFHEENPQLVFAANWIAAIIIIETAVIVYETELQKRSNALNTPARPLRYVVSSFSRSLDEFMHGLIPVKLRTSLDSKSMTYVRVRILSCMLVIATLLSLLHALLLLLLHALFSRDQLRYDWVIIGITLCFGAQLWLFHKFSHYKLSGTLMCYFYFLIVAAFVVASGGYDSPAIILLLLSPLGFFMVGGIRDGIVNAALVGVLGVVLSYLKNRTFDSINLFPDLNIPITMAIAWSIAVTGLGACLLTYDAELEKPE